MATLAQKLRLLGGVMHGEMAFSGPLYVDVDVTRRCNLHCIGCLYHSAQTRETVYTNPSVRDVPMAQIEQLSTELPRLGTQEVFLLGEGEPMLHPRLTDIISAFKAAGCTVHLFTNGTLIDSGRARGLLESDLDEIRVSLWANSLEEYRLCHPGVDADYFARTLNGVESLVELKDQYGRELPTIVLTQPLNRYNYRGIRKRIKLAHDLGCDGVFFDTYRHRNGEFASVALRQEQIENAVRELTSQRDTVESLGLFHNIDRLLVKYRLGEKGWKDVPCYAGWFFSRVLVDGTVVPCGGCSLRLGNVKYTSFQDVWNGARYRMFRRKVLTPGGLATSDWESECGWCCYARDNVVVHRYAKWLAGFRRTLGK